MTASAARPAVSVVVPFLGDQGDADRLGAALGAMRLTEDDEIVIAWNDASTPAAVPGDVRTVVASGHRSSYHARNVGGLAARCDWLLFLDADCRPAPDLLDAFFAPPPPEDAGAVAGAIRSAPGTSLVARYSASREVLSQDAPLAHPRPFANTANLLVRRSAFRAIGGFHEFLRSGGDADFCWRLRAAGWRLGSAPAAAVAHEHRDDLRGFARQFLRYGGGQAWLDRRHRGAFPAQPWARPAARAAAAAIGHGLLGRPERASYRALDASRVVLQAAGRWASNRPRQDGDRRAPVAVMVDRFPALSETFVLAELRALRRLGWDVTVEARDRAERPALPGGSELAVAFAEDDGRALRALALLELAVRSPLGCGRDLVARRRWRREERVTPLRALAPVVRRVRSSGAEHVHAHFAATAALDALRVGRLLGRPFSFTAHGYDIYRDPANLAEKLEAATFATSGSDYTVATLRELAGRAAPRVHRIVMGVDSEQWRRTRPYAADGPVLAIGRLVAKKGFADLVEAVALLRDRGAAGVRAVVVGDGPERDALEQRVAALSLGDAVDLAGALDPSEVKELLETAAVLAAPCVVAPDGDRDSMPVVVKEALAMGIPVVATDEVGLPEVVRPPWGRLAPPHDPEALATAIDELRALPAEELRRSGELGRAYVQEHCDVEAETAKLAALIAAATGRTR